MEKTLFRFVKQVASLAQKLTDAALIQLSHPADNVIRWYEGPHTPPSKEQSSAGESSSSSEWSAKELTP